MYRLTRKLNNTHRKNETVNDINEQMKDRFFFMSHGINGIR